MRKLLLFVLLILGVSIVFTQFSFSQTREKELSSFTQDNCSSIYSFLSRYDSFNLTTGSGKVTMLRPDYSRFERKGCKVSLSGKLPKDEKSVPNMDQYFKDNGWEPILIYMADGHGSGSMGFFKQGKYGDGTFCLKNHDYNVSEGEEPSYLNIDVTCVDGYKEVFVK